MNASPPTCRFCSQPALALFNLPKGCACYPGDRQQALCAQHVITAEPLGEMTLAEILDGSAWEWFKGTQRGWA
jgi:hypothetical protein